MRGTAGQTAAAPLAALTEGVVNTMWLTKLRTSAALATLGLLGAMQTYQAAADQPTLPKQPARETKDQLTAESLAQLHKLIIAQPDEYRWDEIPWFTSIWHARKKAAAENKPLLVFRTHGAGFNDPLGNC
jgi:hypothetical protein